VCWWTALCDWVLWSWRITDSGVGEVWRPVGLEFLGFTTSNTTSNNLINNSKSNSTSNSTNNTINTINNINNINKNIKSNIFSSSRADVGSVVNLVVAVVLVVDLCRLYCFLTILLQDRSIVSVGGDILATNSCFHAIVIQAPQSAQQDLTRKYKQRISTRKCTRLRVTGRR